MSAPNVYAHAARMRKAIKIADCLIRAGAAPDDISDVSWRLAEQVAGVNPASAATRELVVEVLTHRAALVAPDDDEVFSGFGPLMAVEDVWADR